MNQRLSTSEFVLVACAAALGCFLRFTAIDQLAVEHFDEGVYSSTVWYPQLRGEVYPSRHLYAPPALPVMIAVASTLAGANLAPFIPGLLTGTVTILVVWGFTRAAFGTVAGLIVILLAALSDFHILYSRMALTDVPALMWIVLAVWLGVTGIDRRSPGTMLAAGIVCGCAWWTKYTGWLPIAIITSGSLFWWFIGGCRRCPFWRLVRLIGLMTLSACVVWSPWLITLRDVGGYTAVAANHSAYRVAFNSWTQNLGTQITWYSLTDSWMASLAVGLGMTFAGGHRWFEARRSTWNRSSPPGTGITSALLVRFIGAAGVMSIATLTIGSFGVLTALAAGGITGILLCPAFNVPKAELHNDYAGRSQSLTGYQPIDLFDLRAAPVLDSRLAACVVTAWFFGLLLSLPTYTPFPRLLLPLLMAIWIAASAGIGWWVEGCICVVRRNASSGTRPQRSLLKMVVAGLVLSSVGLGLWKLGSTSIPRSRIHDSRIGLRNASFEIASMCLTEAGQSVNVTDDSVTEDSPQCIVYAFGEPAVLYHISQTGIPGVPVQDLRFRAATFHGKRLPTFLVFGPNALRTPRFMHDWIDIEQRFEHLGDVWFTPSPIVLYNLFSPRWILQHFGEEREQRLEVYRLRTGDQKDKR
ncbi:MAG: glycosyltransferase family 39 protein [Fuerstiella sp.]|nr:glycosyltransferase family 39 protein [Fuerstiella sp.]